MNGLDDNDPTNDTAACQKLAMSLFQAGDRKNAGLILAALFGTLEKYMAEKSTQTGAEYEARTTHAIDETEAVPLQTEASNDKMPTTDGDKKPLVDPQISFLKRRDTLQMKRQTSSLALHLGSDAWKYTCGGCCLTAENAGTMCVHSLLPYTA